MRIFTQLPAANTFKNAIVTQGTFDGVHAGHRKIIEQLKKIAAQVNGETVLLTFYPHPRHVLQTHADELKLLSTLNEKIVLLEEAGLDNLVVIPFDQAFANTEPEDFVKNVLCNKFNLHTLVVGYDHRFGKNRKGSFELLQLLQPIYQYQLVQIDAQETEAITVSSTYIRKALLSGELLLANKLLTRPYLFEATVIQGAKIGRTLGFPTANLLPIEPNKLIPAIGTYAVKVLLNNQEYLGMLNIGNNPTILSKGFSIEVNIFNFADELYGQKIMVSFVAKLRNEQKFNSIDELKQQLTKDKLHAIEILQQTS
jgi:riboflavin kinase/FMN adenylyltransferase